MQNLVLEKFTVNEVFITREGKDKKGKGKCMMFAHSFCFGNINDGTYQYSRPIH